MKLVTVIGLLFFGIYLHASDTILCKEIVGKNSDGTNKFGVELITLTYDDALLPELTTPFDKGQPTYKSLGYKTLVMINIFASDKKDAEVIYTDIAVSKTAFDKKTGLLNSELTYEIAEKWDPDNKELVMKALVAISPQNPLKLDDGSLFDYAWVYIMDMGENKVSLNCWQAS